MCYGFKTLIGFNVLPFKKNYFLNEQVWLASNIQSSQLPAATKRHFQPYINRNEIQLLF